MAKLPSGLTIRVDVHERSGGQKVLRLVTWGIPDGGSYGSLGVVEKPIDDFAIPETTGEMARLLLTALYGADYDL